MGWLGLAWAELGLGWPIEIDVDVDVHGDVDVDLDIVVDVNVAAGVVVASDIGIDTDTNIDIDADIEKDQLNDALLQAESLGEAQQATFIDGKGSVKPFVPGSIQDQIDVSDLKGQSIKSSGTVFKIIPSSVSNSDC